MTIYLISDVHLQESDLRSYKLFIDFINTKVKYAEALYILGDLFEFWVGDDYNTPFIKNIKQIFLNLYKQNVSVFIMHGNRDFLLGERFFQETKCTFISDPFVLELNGERLLLTHGDLLCDNNAGYKIFRFLIRNRISSFLFLRLPQGLRIRIARLLRSRSFLRSPAPLTRRYAPPSPRWRGDFVLPLRGRMLNGERVSAYNVIIHGHTHIPGIYEHGKRIVLGSWQEGAEVLEINFKENKRSLYSFNTNAVSGGWGGLSPP